MLRHFAVWRRRRYGQRTSSRSLNCGKKSSLPRSKAVPVRAAAVTAPSRAIKIILVLPKIVLTGLLAVAIGDMIIGVFLRYVMVPVTDWLDPDPIKFFLGGGVGGDFLAPRV